MKAKPITAAILIYLIVALALVISGNAQASASATSEGGSCSSNDVDKNDDSCLANDQTSEPQQQQQQQPPKEPQPVSVTFLNNSPYRADIHYNDGRFGNIVGTANESGGQVQVSTFIGHRFFITMNGVRNSLVDPSTDEQYFFTVGTLPQEQFFVVPKEAAPSETQCKDRYPVCVHEAARGECNVNPGWMIVNCCKSCDDAEGYGNLIDSTIRCDPKRLNSTIPAWKSGSLDTLFDKWATLEEYKQYDPHVISSPNKEMYGGSHEGPWIMTFDNFLDDLEIRSLLKGAQITGFERSTDQGKIVNNQEMVKVTSTSRTSLNAWCRGECEKLPGVKRVTDRIEEVSVYNYNTWRVVCAITCCFLCIRQSTINPKTLTLCCCWLSFSTGDWYTTKQLRIIPNFAIR